MGHHERIRITAYESDLAIAVEGGAADMMFDAQSALPALTGDLTVDMSVPRQEDDSGDYVITLEFHRRRGDDAVRGRLTRMDIHVRDVSVRLRESGYVLEADLTGWVGYTGAFEETVEKFDTRRPGGESEWRD